MIEHDGFFFPDEDEDCHAVMQSEVTVLERHVYPRVTDWTACVQAGGNVGVFPKALARRFEWVYTAEPDPANFACLARNVTEPNVVKLQAALGEGIESPIALERFRGNCGAHQVGGAGGYPVLPIDALRLPYCGLIYLDIEGYEARALVGARDTITRCRPVIGIENKGLSNKYGLSSDAVHELIVEGFKYRRVDKYHKDALYVPEERPC